MRCAKASTFCLLSLVLLCGLNTPVACAQPTPEQIEKIKAAAPEKATAKPEKPRKLLIFNLCKGFRHGAIPLGAKALEILGEKTGAYEAVVSEDVSMFQPDKLRQFDAICFNNCTGELFDDPALKESLLEFVKGGKGIVGIHAATDCFYKWAEFGEMMGGYFDGHPWNESVTVKIDDRDHPINAAFGGKAFEIADEIYQFRDPYSRHKLRVLLSLDTSKTDMTKRGIKRTDGDFAVSWVRQYGKGRVFYCSLGHRNEVFWNPAILRHYLDGIQYALGDLKADATPSHGPDARATQLKETGWAELFNGQDLAGWKGLVGIPKTRGQLKPEHLGKAQEGADRKMREHWKVEDGVLVFDGSHEGSHLCTVKDYGDFELLVDWKIEPGGDSGIYLRGSPQVQIWDVTQHPEGSGGLYNNQNHPNQPLKAADKPVGEWNTFHIKMVGERVTVYLNDVLVTDDVVMENYWERDKPIYPTGQIELQSHGSKLYFKNIRIREIPRGHLGDAGLAGWIPLFNGKDLTGWTCKPGAWAAEDGVLTRKGGSDIWTEGQFDDFVLDLEFKVGPGTNSGVFFRTGDIRDCVQTGIEMQVLDSYGKETVGKHDCGAIYDCLAPRKNTAKPPGEWNHVVLTCKGPKINIELNGAQIIDMDLDQWTDPHQNPDGSQNKFNTAYKDMPRIGHIGFQDHGKPVWYRNIRIKRLD
ncbi:MAG TPA: family 16 glycoside hydrolase [Phycisphaerae bacterium]|nr:family 16 glycoside hydrolase [Phycisphaerae bacterium]